MASDPLAAVTFVERFLARHYLKQPAWLRAGSFIVFLMLFSYGFVTLVSDQRVVAGRVYVGSKPPAYAKNMDVVYGTTWVGTSSKGEFQLPVSLLTYAEISLGKSISVDVLSGDKGPVTVWAKPRESVLEATVDFTAPAPTEIAQNWTEFLEPSLFAEQMADGNRLYLQEIKAPAWGGQSLSWTCQCNGASAPLLSARNRQYAGRLPLPSNGSIALDRDYFFGIGGANNIAARSVLTAQSAAAFNGTETFTIPSSIRLGQTMDLVGSRSTHIRVTLSPGK
jgi:hypothetical protein